MIEKVERAFELIIINVGIPPKIAPYMPIYKECMIINIDIFRKMWNIVSANQSRLSRK